LLLTTPTPVHQVIITDTGKLYLEVGVAINKLSSSIKLYSCQNQARKGLPKPQPAFETISPLFLYFLYIILDKKKDEKCYKRKALKVIEFKFKANF